ncbi:hypothetical protein SELMODRAFT_268258 [Selaginella moellendorffii]|uniref:Autophagy-related protein 16 domain-containing protein n=1 Tax=Selaginella moellendorffii TaxID=88036 RepID=D8S7R6_SELML|nr:autophagy-related protein 16 [Selaginella moellendorffii]EFJ19655.1 hypothetical protein SELMODRAFT_268258 [Selaginella moellendorffii]|eukprot:XP_002979247.1 autophagy-related protein 16 [Selaginella moellendorffii]
MPVPEERAAAAIAQACVALRRRKAVEEGAHASLVAALDRALTNQGTEIQEKMESLQQELSQSYKTQAHVSEQLVVEMQTAQALRAQLAEKDALVLEIQHELSSARARISQLEKDFEAKENAVLVLVEELTQLKLRVKELESSLQAIEAENNMLVDRWMTQKMQDADRLNEANAMYADMMERCKINSLAELAKLQVDGIVRHSEAGAESYMTLGAPSKVRHTLRAHDKGGCAAIIFEHSSDTLLTAGHDGIVKFWDTQRGGTPTKTLTGALGSVLDLALTPENNMVLGGCSDHKLYLWDSRSGRVKHVLTGHTEKVTSVDISNVRAASTASDRTIKTWDLQTGYSLHTMIFHSNCNSLCISSDGAAICSGHTDGILRFWDTRTGKLAKELTAHEPQAITSVSLSRSGLTVLTSGKDNVLKLFDVRSLELKATFRGPGYTVATSLSRSCLSRDENYVAAGSGDGSVCIWNRRSWEVESVLKGGHGSAVVACAWSPASKSLASADRNGVVCVWE